MNDNQDNNEKLARYFFNAQLQVHVVRNDNIFFNGLIKEVGSNFFIINDRKCGHMVVFFQELKYPIEEYQEEEK